VTGQRSARELAQHVAAALEAADLSAYSDLLDPDVRWGPPGDPAPPCRNRDQVLSWYGRGRQAGVRARVTETVVAGDRILVGMRVSRTGTAAAGGQEADRWQVLTVRGGRVSEIVGFDDRREATAWAGLAAEGQPVPRWQGPGEPLADESVALRLPDLADAGTLHAYAAQPGGMDGTWVPLAEGASMAGCTELVRDWQAGWRTGRSFHGPALVIVEAGGSMLVGVVGIRDRGDQVAELDYGVAPRFRGRGYASRAAGLVARWLLASRQADAVELRIDQANLASQRVARAAGFAAAGTVTAYVGGTGESYEDLLFVLRGPVGRG
jgi:RimJ/RimL family protein N-acetyltransferase/ketosteroid isomerase-like protein